MSFCCFSQTIWMAEASTSRSNYTAMGSCTIVWKAITRTIYLHPLTLLSRVALVGIRFSSCSTLSVNRSWPWTDWCSLPHAKRILNTTVSLHPQIHFLESQLFCYRVFFLRGSKLQLYLLLGLGACFGSWEKQCWIYLLYISSYLPPYFCFQNKMNTCFTWNC